jgi:uncharacterized protein YbjT (DUF2867 family)
VRLDFTDPTSWEPAFTGGATAFVDAEDVGAVAAAALLDPGRHRDHAWTVTGPQALTYHQVAQTLTEELARPIRYTAPGPATSGMPDGGSGCPGRWSP